MDVVCSIDSEVEDRGRRSMEACLTNVRFCADGTVLLVARGISTECVGVSTAVLIQYVLEVKREGSRILSKRAFCQRRGRRS
jgi:hypothetical protein